MSAQPTQPNAAERLRIEAIKGDAVNRIWRHTRENQNSLDSQKHCRIIREAIDAAVDSSTSIAMALADTSKSTMAGLRTHNKELKSRVALLEKRLAIADEQEELEE